MRVEVFIAFLFLNKLSNTRQPNKICLKPWNFSSRSFLLLPLLPSLIFIFFFFCFFHWFFIFLFSGFYSQSLSVCEDCLSFMENVSLSLLHSTLLLYYPIFCRAQFIELCGCYPHWFPLNSIHSWHKLFCLCLSIFMSYCSIDGSKRLNLPNSHFWPVFPYCSSVSKF